MNTNSGKMRSIALALLACFLLFPILSGAFILTHANHEHDYNGVGGCCATCAQLQNAENRLKQIAVALAAALISIACLFAFGEVLRAISAYVPLSTPITQKTRMNN